MAVRCPKCAREYDVTLFQFGRSVVCDCGHRITLAEDEIWLKIKEILAEEEDENIRRLQRMVDRVSSLIVASDYPRVDIELEIEKVKKACRQLFPDKMELFNLIYSSRFRRLWEQFRA